MLVAKYVKYTSVDSVDQNWWIHIRRVEHSAHLSPASQPAQWLKKGAGPRNKVRPMVVYEMSPAHLVQRGMLRKAHGIRCWNLLEHPKSWWSVENLLRIYWVYVFLSAITPKFCVWGVWKLYKRFCHGYHQPPSCLFSPKTTNRSGSSHIIFGNKKNIENIGLSHRLMIQNRLSTIFHS